ncbi:MAG: TRAP transporter small permease, partial [Eisenbergiella sp.]
MKVINLVVDKVIKAVMVVSGIVLLAVTFWQVVCRYVLKAPLPWSQDIIRLSFTYLVFWGAAYCVHEKSNLNVDVLLTSLPKEIG